EEFPLAEKFPTANEDKLPLLSQIDATAEELCAAAEVKDATITLSNKIEVPISGNIKWYQSLVRSFDLQKNNIQFTSFSLSFFLYTQKWINKTPPLPKFQSWTQENSNNGNLRYNSIFNMNTMPYGRTVAVTTEDIQKRKNDVKARTTLLLALPDEHQLCFSKYKTAQELWAAILKTFGGNEATKKTKKNLLKQQYGNFNAKGSKTLEQIFNRLQVIVSHLEFMDIEIEKDYMNQKFLTSLAPEWLMHTIVWRNRSDLDTMSLDDLYNHLKVGKKEVNTASIPPASTNVSPASANIEAASISQDIACAYIASQSNDRYWKRTEKKITIQGTDMVGFDKSKVECFNYHKMGHFARECRAPRSQDRGRRDNYRQGSKVEEQALKDLMEIDGVGWDLSYMANKQEDHSLVADEEAPAEFALMAKTSVDSEVFDNSLCSKTCLSQVEARLVVFKNQEVKLCEKIRGLELKVEFKTDRIESLTNELELLKKEKEELDSKLTGFQSASKDLDILLERLPEFADDTVTDYSRPSPAIETDRPTKDKTAKVETVKKPDVKYAEQYRKPSKKSNVRGNQRNWNNLKSQQLGWKKENHVQGIIILIRGKSHNHIDDKAYWDSGCSRHMTGNIYYLSDYEPFVGGYVSFGQGGCKITGKGTIKTGRDFKPIDDTNVVLRTPR
nr:hypothetical protein [Tanacetum cinerariifolium]